MAGEHCRGKPVDSWRVSSPGVPVYANPGGNRTRWSSSQSAREVEVFWSPWAYQSMYVFIPYSCLYVYTSGKVFIRLAHVHRNSLW